MKIILLQDVKSLGKKGDIVNASDGYARNYILPKKLGVEANPKTMNELKQQQAHDQKVKQQILEEAQALAARIEAGEIVLAVKTGEGGKVFGSVSSKEIAGAVATQMGIEIDKKKLQISEPIKTVGVHIVQIKVHPKVTAKLTVKVEEA